MPSNSTIREQHDPISASSMSENKKMSRASLSMAHLILQTMVNSNNEQIDWSRLDQLSFSFHRVDAQAQQQVKNLTKIVETVQA
jgi:hypothetical protein